MSTPLEEPIWDDTSWASGHFLSRRYTIMLAEDDADMRAMLVDDLRRDGYEVTPIRNGGELFDRLREVMVGSRPADRPDLIVTDLRMPGWSGMDVLDFLREIRWRVPVVLITAFGSASSHRLAHQLGAVRVLDKPFALGDLRVAVYEALAAVDSGQECLRRAPRPVGRDW